MSEVIQSGSRTRISLKDLISEPIELEMPDGKIYEVPQPSLRKILKLAEVASELKEAEEATDVDNFDIEELNKLKEFNEMLESFVPPLADYDLALPDSMFVFQEVIKAMKPGKAKFLDEKGINLDVTEKKIEVSPTSNS